ncbi:hypothetical protein BLNAU_18121 [Blattamonas nauphoetae]|uniref:Uncharacterized protein n=1 Tax=Blattamonas nauphoetae TaxID=2049346 RepID=A0ABQ9X5U0_9EUKA|nr:hypothetical protein BLNAU_18121 [Blattamonas nauphoetae]
MDYQSLDFVEQPAGHEPSTTLVETSKHHRPIDTVSGFSGPQTLLMCDLYRLWHPFMISFAGMIGILSRQSRSTFATLSFFFATIRRSLCRRSSSHHAHNTNPNRNCEPRVPCVDPVTLCAADCVAIADAEHTVPCWERNLGASAPFSPIAVELELRGLVVERADASAIIDWFGEHGADLGGLVLAQLGRSQRRVCFGSDLEATRQSNPKLTRTANRGMPSMRQARSPSRLDLVALKTLFSCHAASDHGQHIPLYSGGTMNGFEGATTGIDCVRCRGGSITGQPLPTPSTVFPHTASTSSLF